MATKKLPMSVGGPIMSKASATTPTAATPKPILTQTNQPRGRGNYNRYISNVNAVNSRVTRPSAPQPSTAAAPAPEFRAVERPDAPTFERFDPRDFDVRRYENEALASAMRRLQPQMDSQRADFDQRMINQGIVPGTEAYDKAFANMSRSQNDLRNSALFDAMRFGLQAQGQDFGQQFSANQLNNQLTGQEFDAAMRGAGFDQSEASREFGQQLSYDQLANALKQSRIGANATTTSARISANSALERAKLSDALARDQMAEGSRQFDANFGEGNRRYDLDYGLRSDQQNFGQLAGLADIDLRYRNSDLDLARFNEGLGQQDFANTSTLLAGLGAPNTQNVNVQGAYGINQNSANNAYNQRMQSYRDAWGSAAQLGAAFISSRKFKENGESVDVQATLERVRKLPVETWNYKGDDRQHIGTYAEDFNEMLGSDGDTIGVSDAIGVLTASVQALADRVEELGG